MVVRLVGERLLVTLWVGALWTVGYISAPVLFAQLDDNALAGALAGSMFTVVTYVSLVCGSVLLALAAAGEGFWRRRSTWLVLAMLALIVAGHFGVRPLMQSASAETFASLHGVSQVIYLLVSLLGLALVVSQARSPTVRSAA